MSMTAELRHTRHTGKRKEKLLDSDEVRWWWHVGVGTFL